MKCIRCKTGAGGLRLCADCRTAARAAGLEPGLLAALFEEAAGHFRVGDHASAVRVLQKLLRRDPQNLVAHEILILAYGFLNRFERGMTALASMHRAFPANRPVLSGRTGRKRLAARRGATPADVPQVHATLTGGGSSPSVEAMLNLALFYRQMRQLELAEVLLERVLELEPGCGDALLLQGSIARARGQVRDALGFLESISGTEECAAADYEKGLCYESLGRLKRALRLVTSAVQLEPDNPYMHFTLGTFHEKAGQPQRAQREYRVAASLHPGFSPALADLSFRLGCQSLEEGNLEQALHELEQGVVESAHLFDPDLYAELDRLLDDMVGREAWLQLKASSGYVGRLSPTDLSCLEQLFSGAARLGFFVGLAAYWDDCYESGAQDHGTSSSDVYGPLQASEQHRYELPETEALWLVGVGPSGRMLRGAASPAPRARCSASGSGVLDDLEDVAARVRAEVTSPEVLLGFPPISFVFVLEEWLEARNLLSSPRIQERPLANPHVYQRLITILGSSVAAVQSLVRESLPDVFPDDDDDDDEVPDATAELAALLWTAIIDGYLLRTALERCRAYPQEALVRLGVAQRLAGQRYFERALHELEEAHALMPQSAALHKLRWTLCIRDLQHTRAAELCRQALGFTSHHLFQAVAYNDLAHCMAELGEEPKRALLYADKARELAPQLCEVSARETTAWLSYRQGRMEEALAAIERSFALAQEMQLASSITSIHYYHYGHILRAVGREPEALAAFERACSLEKDADSDWGVARLLAAESS